MLGEVGGEPGVATCAAQCRRVRSTGLTGVSSRVPTDLARAASSGSTRPGTQVTARQVGARRYVIDQPPPSAPMFADAHCILFSTSKPSNPIPSTPPSESRKFRFSNTVHHCRTLQVVRNEERAYCCGCPRWLCPGRSPQVEAAEDISRGAVGTSSDREARIEAQIHAPQALRNVHYPSRYADNPPL